VPLKHSTESAYLILLALVICAAGIAIALLPPYTEGLRYWTIGFVLTLLYPFLLRRTFRTNRADYEFRLLHWFPAGMFVLWMLMQLTESSLKILTILNLGFFYLWSLPLVLLGLFFIAIFAAHVLRRKKQRLVAMTIIGVLFVSSASAVESLRMNPELSRALYPRDGVSIPSATELYATAKQRVGFKVAQYKRRVLAKYGTGHPVATNTSASRTTTVVSSSVRSIAAIKPSVNPTQAPVITKPNSLTQSGPEGFVLLLITLFAFYIATLHRRARAGMYN